MEILSGVAIGLLVGTMIGLSASPVVGTVVGALVALLAAYFGLSGGGADHTNVRRIAAFGFAALLGVFGGLYTRTHGSFSKGVNDRLSEWTAAGFDPVTARHLVVYERTGLITPGWTATADPERAPSSVTSPYLFASAAEKCDQIDPTNYPETVELANAFVQAREGWDRVALATSGLSSERARIVLQASWSLLCEKR